MKGWRFEVAMWLGFVLYCLGLSFLLHKVVEEKDVELARQDKINICRGAEKRLLRFRTETKPRLCAENNTACRKLEAEILSSAHTKCAGVTK